MGNYRQIGLHWGLNVGRRWGVLPRWGEIILLERVPQAVGLGWLGSTLRAPTLFQAGGLKNTGKGAYTVYALAAPVKLDLKPSEVNREVLLAAMQDRILATAELRVVYSRSEGASGQGGAASQAGHD